MKETIENWKVKVRLLANTHSGDVLVELVSSLIDKAKEEERERIKIEVSIMGEPIPSANDSREYNRGVYEGVTHLRNRIVNSLKLDNK